MGKYVIAVQRIRNYASVELKEEDKQWEYATYHLFAGVHSTGKPMMYTLAHALQFNSIEEAKDWWSVYREYMVKTYNMQVMYDMSTLGIKQIQLRDIEKL